MVLGAAVVLLASFGWVLEPSVPEAIDYASPDGDGHSQQIATHG